MSQEQQNIDLFLREYRELCERYSILIDTTVKDSIFVAPIDGADMDDYIRYLRRSW